MKNKMRGHVGAALAAMLASAMLLVGCGGGGGSDSGAAASPQGSDSSLAPDNISVALDGAPASANSFPVNLVAGGYFAVSQGSSWVYDSTVDGSTTVGGVTRVLSRGGASGESVTVQELDGEDISTEAYTLTSGGVEMSDPTGAETLMPGVYDDLRSWLVYPNKDLLVGLISEVSRAGSTKNDLDGDGKSDCYRLHAQYLFKGLKALDVLGAPTDVAHVVSSYVIEFTYSRDGSKRKITVLQSDGYAKGLGLVQSDRVVVSDGSEILRQAIKLRSARVNGVDYAIAKAKVSPASITQIIPTVGWINPAGDYFKASVMVEMEQSNRWIAVSLGRNDIVSGSQTVVDDKHVKIDLTFRVDGLLGKGAHNDTLTISVCEDRACKVELPGSPFLVPITAILSGTQAPEADVAELKPISQQLLAHDVVAAKYSRSLDRVVMISGAPENRLYVLDPATGAEQSIPLSRAPLSLAISPNGQHAGVGQDGRVTWVNLNAAAVGRSDVKEVNITTVANQVAVDNDKRIYVVPGGSAWESLHTADVASGTESLTNLTGKLNGGDTITMRADGRSIYTQLVGVSSYDVHEWALTATTPVFAAATVTYAINTHWCPGPLWMSVDDARLVTACGTVVNALPGGAANLKYHSRIPLSVASRDASPYRLKDLSQSPATMQWAALEYDLFNCNISVPEADTGECYHHLVIYDDDSYKLRQKFALGSVAIAGVAYDQEGVAVFHSGNGEHLYLVTHLRRTNQDAASYLFQVVR